MSNAKKINQLLDLCCQDVFEILNANRERAAAFLIENGPYADGFVDFANWTLDGNENLLKYCIDASSFSDLTVVLMRTMAADGEFETEELEEAASLVSQSCHRYFWLDDYEKYDGGIPLTARILDARDSLAIVKMPSEGKVSYVATKPLVPIVRHRAVLKKLPNKTIGFCRAIC